MEVSYGNFIFVSFFKLAVSIFQWDKALSFAPAVSLEYWKSLMERYVFIYSI